MGISVVVRAATVEKGRWREQRKQMPHGSEVAAR